MMPLLMEWTADFTVLGLRATGIPVYREGLQFAIPSGTWSVVEACSGMRYLIASLMLGTLYAYLSYRSLTRQVVFIAFSTFVPVLANWIRAYLIVMIGHLSDNALARGVDHLVYGWLFFGAVVACTLWVGARWREDDRVPRAYRVQRAAAVECVAPTQLWMAVAAVAAVTAFSRVGCWALERSVTPRLELPSLGEIGGWSAKKGGLTDWHPSFKNPSTERHYSFNRDRLQVGLYVGYYEDEADGHELVSSENVLVGSHVPAWAKVASGTRAIETADKRFMARTAELQAANGERLMVWQWYWINGHLTASEQLAKAYTVLARLMRRGHGSAVVIAYAPRNQPQGAETALEGFIQDAAPTVLSMLDKTRER